MGDLTDIIKYPRTPHLEGSRLQPGDSAEDQVSLTELRRRYSDCTFVTEEKLDGANSGISFDGDLSLRLQSRGHVLSGGAREGQFNLFKEWATVHEAAFLDRFEDRYQVYGEWTFARHTQFYDALPHFFHEFDIWDKSAEAFLSTPARQRLLEGLPIVSVPVVSTLWPATQKDVRALIRPSLYRTPEWREALGEQAAAAGVSREQAFTESGADQPDADLAEGVYIKIETAEHTVARFKFIRPGFLQTILEAGGHWSQRPIIRNCLNEGVDIFAKNTPFKGPELP